MGERCTGIEETILEDGVHAYKLIKHVTLVDNGLKETWLKRCIPCQSLQIRLLDNGNKPSYWKVQREIEKASVLRLDYYIDNY